MGVSVVEECGEPEWLTYQEMLQKIINGELDIDSIPQESLQNPDAVGLAKLCTRRVAFGTSTPQTEGFGFGPNLMTQPNNYFSQETTSCPENWIQLEQTCYFINDKEL